jgi:hypothetical protein
LYLTGTAPFLCLFWHDLSTSKRDDYRDAVMVFIIASIVVLVPGVAAAAALGGAKFAASQSHSIGNVGMENEEERASCSSSSSSSSSSTINIIHD